MDGVLKFVSRQQRIQDGAIAQGLAMDAGAQKQAVVVVIVLRCCLTTAAAGRDAGAAADAHASACKPQSLMLTIVDIDLLCNAAWMIAAS